MNRASVHGQRASEATRENQDAIDEASKSQQSAALSEKYAFGNDEFMFDTRMLMVRMKMVEFSLTMRQPTHRCRNGNVSRRSSTGARRSQTVTTDRVQKSKRVQYEMVSYQLAAMQKDEAAQEYHLAQAREIDPADPELSFLLAERARRAGKPAEVLELCGPRWTPAAPRSSTTRWRLKSTQETRPQAPGGAHEYRGTAPAGVGTGGATTAAVSEPARPAEGEGDANRRHPHRAGNDVDGGFLQLRADKSVWDFGTRPQATRVDGSFLLFNDADRPLSIRSLKIDCFCAKGKLSSEVVPAGESVTLDIRLDTGAYEGEIDKAIRVTYFAGTPRTMTLRLKGRITAAWTALPTEIHLGGIRAGTRLERRIEVLQRDDAALELEASCSEPAVKIDCRRLPPPQRGWSVDLAIEIPSAAKPGEFRAEVVLEVDDATKPSQRIPLIGRVESDLSVRPRRLAFGRVSREREIEVELVLESRSGRAFQITRVLEDLYLLVDAKTGKPASRHVISITLPKGLPLRSLRGRLVFQTDHPEESRVEVAYSARIVKP